VWRLNRPLEIVCTVSRSDLPFGLKQGKKISYDMDNSVFLILLKNNKQSLKTNQTRTEWPKQHSD
jgi:hypothetical protein